MEVDLLEFIEQCRHLVKQALGKRAGEPASGGFARWKHVVLHCFRLKEDHSYRETPNRLEYMAEIRDVLNLDRDDLPDYSTIYSSSTRSPDMQHSTARSSTAARPRRTTASGREVMFKH